MSDGTLEIVPLGDVAFGDYVPDLTVQYALTEDDLVTGSASEDPVGVKRTAREEVYNIVPVEFMERDPNPATPSKAYVARTVEDPDPVDVALNGPRRSSAVSMPMIALPSVALTISRLRAQRAVKRRNAYKFKLGWHFAPLEPLDYLSLSDSRFGFADRVVRITAIEEDEHGTLIVEAEDAPFGMSHAVAHTVQSSASPWDGLPYVPVDVALAAQATAAWQNIALGGGTYQNAVCWSRTRWVVAGNSNCFTTNDPTGLSGWTARTMPATYVSALAADGNGTVIAVGSLGSSCARSTDDGATWAAVTLPTQAGLSVAYNDVIWDPVHSWFVAVGIDGAANAAIATSPTGATGTWTLRTVPVAAQPFGPQSIAFNGTALVVVGPDTHTTPWRSVAMTSTDGGVTWTNVWTLTAATTYDVVYAVTAIGSRFVMAGQNGFVERVSDDNGATWKTVSGGPTDVQVLASDGKIVLALRVPQAAGSISVDRGDTWIQRQLPTSATRSYHRAAYNGHAWVAVASDSSAAVTVSLPRAY
jgi:hypothetical protein